MRRCASEAPFVLRRPWWVYRAEGDGPAAPDVCKRKSRRRSLEAQSIANRQNQHGFWWVRGVRFWKFVTEILHVEIHERMAIILDIIDWWAVNINISL